jgi:bifunctional DNA-binding transcriptional regulator/antitoxin component of YhaV-PrlF toxin-antitoxin module
MILQKQVSRRSKNKTYNKWIISIPNEDVIRLKWKPGQEIVSRVRGSRLILIPSQDRSIATNPTMIKSSKRLTAFERFAKVYSNLPLEEREMIIVVVGNNPITWKMAYEHMRNRTELGNKIGKKLIKLRII